MRATLQDERSRVTFVRSGETRAYPKEEFFYFSAFPMEGRAEGVCEHGSYYELTDDVLVAGYPLGVSNEYAEAQTASPSPPARGRWWSWKRCRIHRS